MGVNWQLSNPSGGFDYLQSLRALGEAQTRSLQNEAAQHTLLKAARQDAARPQIANQIASNNLRGARASAVGAGDYDMASAIGGLSDADRKQLDAQNEMMGRVALSLKQMPSEGRAAAFQAVLPRLRQMGFHDDELNGVADFSDGTLDHFIGMSQSIKDHLASQLTQARIADVGIDNERADTLAGNTIRNTEDVIADRAARRGIAIRGQDLADARGRYGIAVSSSDRRRGQNMADARGRYGIDVASADRRRGQDLGPGRGPRRQGNAAGQPVRVQNIEQARRLPPGTIFETPDGQRKVR
jgi:hypothetical protein